MAKCPMAPLIMLYLYNSELLVASEQCSHLKYEAYKRKTFMSLIAMQPLVPDHAYILI